MGVLTPGSAHARPSARPPIDTSGNFSAYMSGVRGVKLSESFSNQLSRQIREFSALFFFSQKKLKILGGVKLSESFSDQLSRQIREF